MADLGSRISAAQAKAAAEIAANLQEQTGQESIGVQL